MDDVKEIAGRGLSGVNNGVKYYARNKKLMDYIQGEVKDSEDTVIQLATDGQYLASAIFASEIKPGTEDVIAQLRKQVVRTVMLTGDNRATAKGWSLSASVTPFTATD